MVSDGRAALAAALKLEPDLVVLDISMPLMSGIEVAEELQRQGSKTKVVFLTVHEDYDILKTCRAAGGFGLRDQGLYGHGLGCGHQRGARWSHVYIPVSVRRGHAVSASQKAFAE